MGLTSLTSAFGVRLPALDLFNTSEAQLENQI